MLETGHVGLGRLSVKDEIFVYLFLFFKCLIQRLLFPSIIEFIIYLSLRGMRCTAQVRGLQHRSTRLRLHVELPLERCSQWPVLCDIHSDVLLLVNNNQEPSIHWIHSLIPGVSFGKFFALLPLNITLPHSLFSFILGSHCTYVESFYDASLFSYIILCTFHSYH